MGKPSPMALAFFDFGMHGKAAMGWQPGQCHAPVLSISSKQLVFQGNLHSNFTPIGLVKGWTLGGLASCPSGSFVGLEALEDGDEAWREDDIWNTTTPPLRFHQSSGSIIPNSWTWRKLIHHIFFDKTIWLCW